MPPTTPPGTSVSMLPPTNVQVGDRIWLYDRFLRIADLRATQDGTGRILLFEGRDPFVMRAPMPICRPVGRS